MELNKQQFLDRFLSPKKKRTETQLLCDEIFEHFEKAIPYGQLLGFCKLQGTQAIREQFEEFKKYSKVKTPAYFIGILKKNKTIFKTVDN